MKSPFIFDWVVEHGERHPDRPAIDAANGPRLTYAALSEYFLHLAADLAEKGVEAGDRVLVALPPGPATVVAGLAIQWIGACCVDADRTMGAAALESVLTTVSPRYAIIHAADAALWDRILRGRQFEAAWAVVDGDRHDLSGLAARAITRLGPDGALASRTAVLARAQLDDSAAAVILLTSGSTGTPRAVVHTFRNIAANTRSIVEYLGLSGSDRAMAILPFTYTYGRSVLQTHLYVGGSVFADHRFLYPRTVMEAIGTEGCTGFSGVPLTFELLRRSVDVRGIAMPSLRYVTQAGGAMRPETIRWARAAFAPARLFVMYGQTEATARLSYVPPEAPEEKVGSIGIPIPNVELRIVDETGRAVPDGSVGHLVAHGDNVTPGYFDAPEATARILRDGWLWTGDLARKDADGYFWLEGRLDDLLKIGGYRVSANEIEAVLREHPSVSDAAVVGVEDALQGKIAFAFVVLVSPVEDGELRRFCRERGGTHKVPAEIVVIDAIPRTPSGKPLKADLVARARKAREGMMR